MDRILDELESQVDLAVFGTKDPLVIREEAMRAIESWQRERSTLGGYLRDIRRGRSLSTAECALKVGVSREMWQSWESNRAIPCEADLQQVCEGLHFGERKKKRLKELLHKAPENLLLLVSRFQPQLMAAQGANRMGASLEWCHFPEELQRAIISWGAENGFRFPGELPRFFLTFKDEEHRREWVSSVVARSHDLA